ncbi:MAG: carboxymuconolactone decarboxylase family protein [Planctomycetota bacterium]
MTRRSELRRLLTRPDLPSRDRLLVILHAALVRPDHELLLAAAGLALDDGLSPESLREACLQGALYAGFPRALAALELIAPLMPGPEPERSALTGLEERELLQRGAGIFARIYGPTTEQVLEHVERLDPAFAELILSSAYGRVLSRPALELRVRELMAVAALSLLDQAPQLLAHARGALHAGATRPELLETLSSVGSLFPATSGHLHLLETFLDKQRGGVRRESGGGGIDDDTTQ